MIDGQVFVDGSGTVVEIQGLRIDPTDTCFADALIVQGGARANGNDLVVINGPGCTVIFMDGFESGDVSSWS